MTEQPPEHRTPEGFDSRNAFVRAVDLALRFPALEFSNGYPRHGIEFGDAVLSCAFALLACPFDDTPSAHFNLPEGKDRTWYQQATYDLAEFLATAKAKRRGEDDTDLEPVYEFMKLLGIPIIEYRDKVGPNTDNLDIDELEAWEKEQAEAKGEPVPAEDTPATSDD